MKTKLCKCCGRELPLTEFPRNLTAYTCKKCVRKKQIELKKRKQQRKINKAWYL